MERPGLGTGDRSQLEVPHATFGRVQQSGEAGAVPVVENSRFR